MTTLGDLRRGMEEREGDSGEERNSLFLLKVSVKKRHKDFFQLNGKAGADV